MNPFNNCCKRLAEIIVFNKPFQVLSQFTDTEGRDNLGNFINHPNFYAAGRLDYDSEGLLVLTNHGPTQHLITSEAWNKTYLVQVEGRPQVRHLEQLRAGVKVKDYLAKAIKVELLAKRPAWVWKRLPPIRVRKNAPTSWLLLTINQGKNRQVRRMCAAVGLPVLRLIRTQMGDLTLEDLVPGAYNIKSFDLKP